VSIDELGTPMVKGHCPHCGLPYITNRTHIKCKKCGMFVRTKINLTPEQELKRIELILAMIPHK